MNKFRSIIGAAFMALSLLFLGITTQSCGLAQKVVCPQKAWAQTALSNAENDLTIAQTYLDKFVSDNATVTIPGIGTVTKGQLTAAIATIKATIAGLNTLLAVNCPATAAVETAIANADTTVQDPLVSAAIVAVKIENPQTPLKRYDFKTLKSNSVKLKTVQ